MTTPAALPSWTRSLPERDSMLLLEAAVPGAAVCTWRLLADQSLPHVSPKRRKEVVGLVEKLLLDCAAGLIRPSRFLLLFHRLGAQGRRELVWGRYGFGQPVVRAALTEVIAPVAARLGEPLVPEGALAVPMATWFAWLKARQVAGASTKSAINTRGNLTVCLRAAGIVAPATRKALGTELRHGRPVGEAFGWLVGHQMRAEHRFEATETWACRHSFASQFFLPEFAHAALAVDRAVAVGVLRRSYLAGEARLHAEEEA